MSDTSTTKWPPLFRSCENCTHCIWIGDADHGNCNWPVPPWAAPKFRVVYSNAGPQDWGDRCDLHEFATQEEATT